MTPESVEVTRGHVSQDTPERGPLQQDPLSRARAATAFIGAALRHPLRVGAIAPASRVLADAIAARVPRGGTRVLELGPGTGSVTRALRQVLCAESDLVLVELCPAMAAASQSCFPDSLVLVGDATRLRRVLSQRMPERFDAIVSSLPLRAFSLRQQIRLGQQFAGVLRTGGTLIQYTYGLQSPLAPSLCRRAGLIPVEVVRVWRNLPPAAVWTYRYEPRLARADFRKESPVCDGDEPSLRRLNPPLAAPSPRSQSSPESSGHRVCENAGRASSRST